MTKKCKNTRKNCAKFGGFYPDSGFLKNVLGLFCITFFRVHFMIDFRSTPYQAWTGMDRHGQACPYQVWTGSGRALCYKTFCQKIPDFSPDSGFFRNFFISPWSLDYSRHNLLVNKLECILISLHNLILIFYGNLVF